MFLRNAVPMTNGIQINAGVSICYFIMSILTLLFLCYSHQAASQMVIRYQGIVLLFWGILCLVLTIIGITEMDAAGSGTDEIYNKLSVNSKSFFENDVQKLKEKRTENT